MWGIAHFPAEKSGFSGLTGHGTMVVMMEQHDHPSAAPPCRRRAALREKTTRAIRAERLCKEVPSFGARTARKTRRGPPPPGGGPSAPAAEAAQAPEERRRVRHRDHSPHRRRHLRHVRRDLHDLCEDHPGPHPGCGHRRLQHVPVHHRLLHGQGDRGGCGAGDPEERGKPHPGGL